MKKYLFLIIVFLIAYKQYGQLNFNRAFHNNYETAHPMLTEINNEYYFASLNTSQSLYGLSYLYKVNTGGNLIFRKLILADQATINQSFKSLDNKLIILNNVYNTCDVPDTSRIRTYLTKLDTNGLPIFNLKIKRAFGNYGFDHFTTALQLSDSTYYAFTDSVMYKISKLGTVLSQKNTGLNSIKCCVALQNGNMLLSAKNGTINSLIEINTNATIINQQPASLFNKLMPYGTNNFIGVGYNFVTKLSPNYQTIATNPIIINDAIIKNDTIYYLSTSSGLSSYKICDTSFNQIYSSVNATQNYSASKINLLNNKISIVGTGSSLSNTIAPSSNPFISIINTNKFANINFVSDGSISQIIQDSMKIFNILNNTYDVGLKAKVWVKNKGNITLTAVKLNCFMNFTIICGNLYYQKDYTNLNIAPNDSIQLVTDYIYKRVYTSNNQTTITANYCIYTTLPNNENDKNISNDGLCMPFTFNVPVSIKENNLDKIIVDMSPNPFTETITCSSQQTIKTIEIMDVYGMALYSSPVNANTFMINEPTLKSGIYFIKIYFNNNYTTKKIIKY